MCQFYKYESTGVCNRTFACSKCIGQSPASCNANFTFETFVKQLIGAIKVADVQEGVEYES